MPCARHWWADERADESRLPYIAGHRCWPATGSCRRRGGLWVIRGSVTSAGRGSSNRRVARSRQAVSVWLWRDGHPLKRIASLASLPGGCASPSVCVPACSRAAQLRPGAEASVAGDASFGAYDSVPDLWYCSQRSVFSSSPDALLRAHSQWVDGAAAVSSASFLTQVSVWFPVRRYKS